MIETSPPPPKELVELLELTARVHGIEPYWLSHQSRPKRLADARAQYCTLARACYPYITLQVIGETIARDHTTVCHSIRRHPFRLMSCTHYRRTWDIIQKRLSTLKTEN